MAKRKSTVEGADNLRAIPKILLELAIQHLNEIEEGKYGMVNITESKRTIGLSRQYACLGRTFDEVHSLNPEITKKYHYDYVAKKIGHDPAKDTKWIPDDEVLHDPYVENTAFSFVVYTDGVPLSDIARAIDTSTLVLESVGFTIRNNYQLPCTLERTALMKYTGTNYIEIGDGLNSPELTAFLRVLYAKYKNLHPDLVSYEINESATTDTRDLRDATRQIKQIMCSVDRTRNEEHPRLGAATLQKLINECIYSCDE